MKRGLVRRFVAVSVCSGAAFLLSLISPRALRAQSPFSINYQGLLEEEGELITGTRSLLFKIYDSYTGGSILWQSGKPAGSENNVTVEDGLFSYMLGGSRDADNLSIIDWDNNAAFLEVIVEGYVMTPRERLVAAPYAFNADRLDGQDGSFYTDIDNVVAGTLPVARGGTGGATAADARANLGLLPGTDVQAQSANLDAIAGLVPADGDFIVGDGSDFVTENGATARNSLGLGVADSPTFAGLTTTGATTLGATTAASLDASSGGITSAGAISGATTIDATGLASVESLNVNAGAATIANTGAATVASLDASNGGITNAGPVSGVTTLTATGACDLGATTVDSLNASGGGITNGLLFPLTVGTTYNSDDMAYTPVSMTGGLITRTGYTSANDTTPTAAAIVASVPGAVDYSSFRFMVRNAGAGTVTLAPGGPNVTIDGPDTVPSGQMREFVTVVTDASAGTEAVTIYGGQETVTLPLSLANGGLGADVSGFNGIVSISGGTATALADPLTLTHGGTGAATAAAARTNLGLGTLAQQDAGAVAITGGAVTGITDLAVADGGTGASTAAGARTSLGLGTIATQDASVIGITGGSITGITDLAIADGGTGASTAADARTNLGIGTLSAPTFAGLAVTGAATVGSLDAGSGLVRTTGAADLGATTVDSLDINGAATVTGAGGATVTSLDVNGVAQITGAGAATVTGLDAGAGVIQNTGSADLGATTVDSLDVSDGGIVDAGDIGADSLTIDPITGTGIDLSGTSVTNGRLFGLTSDTNVVGNDVVYSAGAMTDGLIVRSGYASANDATAAAANIVAAIPGAVADSSFRFFVRNAGAGTIALSGGAGVTMAGSSSVPPGETQEFLAVVTNPAASSEAVTVHGVQGSITLPLALEYGGLGVDASGFNGLVSISGGAAAVIADPLPVANGGTGATTAATARTALGAAASGVNADITQLSGLTTALSIGQGGTGATTAAGARTGLGAAASGVNADITQLTGLTTALSIGQGGTGATTQAGARTALGLGTIATQDASSVAITGGTLNNITGLTLTGSLAVSEGGTGATDAAGARASLGAAASGANSDITSLSGLTTALSVAQGGTGSANAAGARANLGAAASGVNADITQLSGLTTALSIGQGGTGGTDAAGARASLGAAASGANSDITQLTGLTTALSLAQGGTGGTDAATARASLGAAQSGVNADITQLTGLTTPLSIGQGGTGAVSQGGARTALGLGTIATQDANNVAVTGGTLNNISSLTLTGSLAVSEGGTGATDAGTARANIGSAASGANSDITSLSGLTTALSIGQGGTGATTQAGARASLGAAASGANSDITQLTGLTTALSLAQGGTGGTDAGTARASLGAAQSGVNADITQLTGLTTPLSIGQGGTGAATQGGARAALGLGTIATQDANNVAITGGTLNNLSALTLANPLAITQGGTGASSVADARSNLGLGTADSPSFAAVTASTGNLTASTGNIIVATGDIAAVLGDVTAGNDLNAYNNLVVDGDSTLGDATNDTTTINDILQITGRAAAPGAPVAGMVYYDTTTNKLRCYDGTSWQDLF